MQINRGNFQSNIIFLNKCNLRKSDLVLEIGSGTGYLKKYLENRKHTVIGTEINDEYIKFAKEKYGVTLQRMHGTNIRFPDNHFNVVMSFDVFEHIPNSDKHLREVWRVLKKNGYYLLQTPNKWSNIPFEIIKTRSLVKYRKYHCSLYNYWQLKKKFIKNGFQIDFVNVPVINRYFRRKLKKSLGKYGLFFLHIVNLDKLPLPLRTNFYIVAQKVIE